MDVRTINNIPVTVIGDISDEEIAVYLEQIGTKQKRKVIKADITVDGDYVDVNYKLYSVPFERIRRITGYLVGSTTKWNNAKRSEEKDRVKHC